MVTTANNSAQQSRSRFYTLPFISNYVRDETNNVYCIETGCSVGKWNNTQGTIAIDGDYYHGPPVEFTYEQHTREVTFIQRPTTTRHTLANPIPEFFDADYHAYEPTMEPLELSDLMPEEGETTELFPIHGASLFKYSNRGHIVQTQVNELTEDMTSVGYPIITTHMGPLETFKVVKIKFFPQYRHLATAVENHNVVV
jgi:hypothetical protein